MRRATILLTASLAGCTATTRSDDTDAARLAEALAGRTAGAARHCVDPQSLDGPEIIGQAIVYSSAGTLWVTRPVDSCPSLTGDQILIVKPFGGQLCENDQFRALPRGTSIPGAYCRFGSFTPYAPPR